MAKHSVNVIVKARDEASRKFKTIGSSAVGMGNMLKKAAAAAVVYFGARAIARFAKSSLDAFMKQEDAVFLLATALKTAGEYSERTMEQFKEFASSIQQATIYGDEEVLSLMQLQKSLGVSADKLELATKQAIGLAAATGREVKSMAMYISLAHQGEFTMLRRYIPALRQTTDATEQLAIITKFCADGFEVAKAQAETTSGALKQAANAFGDAVKETIGEAFAPVVKKWAKMIKAWSEDNKKWIGDWAKDTVDIVILVKDVFRDFIKFMKEDWIAGLKFSLDATIELFIGLGKSLGVIFREISENMIAAYGGKYERPMAGARAEEILKREILKERGQSIWWGSPEELRAANLEARRRLREFGATAYIEDVWAKDMANWEGIRTRVISVWKETTKNIAKITPPKLAEATEKSWEEYLKRRAVSDRPVRMSWMDSIREWRNAIREWWTKPEKTGTSTALATAISKQLRPLEARFLTFAPGTRFNKTEYNTAQTAKNTNVTVGTLKELNRLTMDLIKAVRTIPGPWPLGTTSFK